MQSNQLVQATIRLRADQKARMESEVRARGGNLADVLRDNIDLAFALKSELSKIVEGEYDEHDPTNAPKLVHSLLFRVEERILNAMDNLSIRLENSLANFKTEKVNAITYNEIIEPIEHKEEVDETIKPINIREHVESFISIVTEDNKYPPTVWLGAFLELIPRIGLINQEQIQELQRKGENWLEEA